MLIRAVRLLNVKSFGPGPEGSGSRLAFERGLNRIAGKNGAGKSSVIEALGYALFDSAPDLGARMDLDTALLRHDAHEGEIEVELETPDGLYRVRRGVGKRSKLRWTVADASGFVTHETEPEVRRFLAAAAGIPSPDRLTDLFRKLLGVRQGRLLDPYEFAPAEARRYFAPILNVEVYQRCFTDLAQPVQRLKEELLVTEGRIRAARGQAEVLAGSAAEAAALEERVARARPGLEQARQALTRAITDRDAWEQRASAIPAANEALARARKDVEKTDGNLVLRRELLGRAEQAHGVLNANAAAHAAYRQAEKELAEVAARRPEFEALRKDLAGRRESLAGSEARAQETRKRADALLAELGPQLEELARRSSAWEERQRAFEAGASGDSMDVHAVPGRPPAPDAETQKALETVERWCHALAAAAESARHAGELAATANAALANFDPDRKLRADEELAAAQQAAEGARTAATELEARRGTRREMARELQTARQCPLLNQRCKQFEEGHLVLSEVNLDRAVELASQDQSAAEEVLRRADEAAAKAKEEADGTLTTRARASTALEDIGRQLALARDAAARAAFDRVAASFAAPDAPAPRLPELAALPDPGEEPWKALSAGPEVADGLCAFARAVGEATAKWKAEMESRKEAAAERRHQRDLEQQRLKQEEAALAKHRAQLEKCRAEQEGLAKQVAAALEEASQLTEIIAQLAAKQAEFEALEARAAQAQAARAAAEEGHRKYVAAEADARRLEQARADVALAVGLLELARREAASALKARDAAQAAYDAEAHARARAALEEAAKRVNVLETQLERDEKQLEDARRRAAQLAAALDELRVQTRRQALLEARRDLLEHLRKSLRDAGPLVAEQLVQAVNARAQTIFSALTPHDPARLDWQSDYELCVITTSGTRRFATLSGGQKVKAALALQLALVQQFSQAGLCIFDEPTYALDAESRERLSLAIVEAQAVSRFEQLFIVSHDDAFDELVEHTVMLEYSPANGTRVVPQ
jgi:exonuclease SbcC